ncbi:MAG: PD40 domain-containing protein [Bacteroidales bacterium]|nr:PD40 domain-containing protein [Bacteroidales bacterium]
MKTRRIFLLTAIAAALLSGCGTFMTVIDTSETYVPEEGGIVFVKVTNEDNEQLIVPNIRWDGMRLTWWANPYFVLTKDGDRYAYIGSHNSHSNIFVKSLAARSGSQQRTFSNTAQDLCFSPDGKKICFSQSNYPYSNLYLTSAVQGSIVQQVTSGSVKDYAPIYSTDGKLIFFHRAEGSHYGIWSYSVENGVFSNYCYGLTPYPINEEEFLCSRKNSMNNYEIWLVNYVKGTESLILSQENRSFTTASLSPDGKWILFTANTQRRENLPENLDIFVIRSDGSQMTQLTYHPGHDLSPTWSPDGKSIYFLSQRGSDKGSYNIWKMNFNL